MFVLHFKTVPHPSHTSTFTSHFLKYRENKRLKIAPSEGPVKGIILAFLLSSLLLMASVRWSAISSESGFYSRGFPFVVLFK